MRIAMVSEHASPLAVLGGVDAGGQNVHVAALSCALAARGHRVEVYTRRDDPALPDRVRMAPGVEVVHVPAGPARHVAKDELLPWMPAFAAWLQRAWSGTRPGDRPDSRPEVVHAHFWMSGVAALEACRATGLPLVQTFHALGSVKRRHQGDHDTSPEERVALEAQLAREADLVIATCSDEVAELRDLVPAAALRTGSAGAGAAPVRVVPCGVDTDRFTPSGPALERGEHHRLVSVGRLVERKGVDAAVRALRVLPDAELLVVGGPPVAALPRDPEAVRLVGLAEDLGVADRVRLLGRVDQPDLPRVLRSADVVVATPWYEPFGIAPLEAMACGRPVVGTAVGGLLDTVDDGTTGSLVPPRDPGALAAAVRPLLDDTALRERWGRAGRRRAVARYSWKRVAAATEDAYVQVVEGARGSAARMALDERTETAS
ncbi:glycosyltransferase [Quadrisphaera sp. INWT6]|uniref:glycosyltransferase n=1 Tax=Quadrisphaera sp. INWT6 TaxID=2596917 RepID=UPI00189259B4|nr:glycosyltransferase [Quadrisphaera sp. INWT6]MBF5082272.1 glycosyltransferase family 1 protein [Quadrisphaera sp. INWT6]